MKRTNFHPPNQNNHRANSWTSAAIWISVSLDQLLKASIYLTSFEYVDRSPYMERDESDQIEDSRDKKTQDG